MSVLSQFPPKEKLITRTYEIDVSLYEKLEYLVNEVYDTSINKMVNACLDKLLKTKNVNLYSRPKNEISIARSFGLRESLYQGLSDLRIEYNTSFNRLINIAIRNALLEEGFIEKWKDSNELYWVH